MTSLLCDITLDLIMSNEICQTQYAGIAWSYPRIKYKKGPLIDIKNIITV